MLTASAEGTLLQVRVVPGARKSQLMGEENGRLKVRLQAPPVGGKANKALLAFLARELGLRKNRLELVTGERSREKKILLKLVPPEAARVMIKSAMSGE